MAACKGNLEIVRLLLERGADIKAKRKVTGYYLRFSLSFLGP